VTKVNTTSIPKQIITADEVTSSDQSSSAKRQRAVSIGNNTVMNSCPSSASSSPVIVMTANSPNGNAGSDDQRKKQIRDSNREAARRCRERRRQYIEQLEGNLEQSKLQIKQLSDKLVCVERENIQLRALLSETKLIQPGSRLPSSESLVEYVNVVSSNGLDHNSDTDHAMDGATMQRNYVNRNHL
jgi:uncharacterized membrane protein